LAKSYIAPALQACRIRGYAGNRGVHQVVCRLFKVHYISV
jgi:hypothetical protein